MSEWSGGTGALARILYRDGQAVGMVDSPEIAAEIVETMNRVGALLDEVRREPVDAVAQHVRESAGGRVCVCKHCTAKRYGALGRPDTDT